MGASLHSQPRALWPETPRASPVPPHPQCPLFLEQGWTVHPLSRTGLLCLLWVVIQGLGHLSWHRAMHKQCMGEQQVRADHAFFSQPAGKASLAATARRRAREPRAARG